MKNRTNHKQQTARDSGEKQGWEDPAELASLVDSVSTMYDQVHDDPNFPYTGDDFRRDMALFLCRIASTKRSGPDKDRMNEIASLSGVSIDDVQKIAKDAQRDKEPRIPRTMDAMVRFADAIQSINPIAEAPDMAKILFTLYGALGSYVGERCGSFAALGSYMQYLLLFNDYFDERDDGNGMSTELDNDG